VIIFGGWGSVVALLGLGAWLRLTEAVTDSPTATWLSVLVGGVGVVMFGQWLHDNDFQVISDDDGRPVATLQRRHHLFWITVRWWGVIVVAVALIGLATASVVGLLLTVAALAGLVSLYLQMPHGDVDADVQHLAFADGHSGSERSAGPLPGGYSPPSTPLEPASLSHRVLLTELMRVGGNPETLPGGVDAGHLGRLQEMAALGLIEFRNSNEVAVTDLGRQWIATE
jgi:hypothetical protein